VNLTPFSEEFGGNTSRPVTSVESKTAAAHPVVVVGKPILSDGSKKADFITSRKPRGSDIIQSDV